MSEWSDAQKLAAAGQPRHEPSRSFEVAVGSEVVPRSELVAAERERGVASEAAIHNLNEGVKARRRAVAAEEALQEALDLLAACERWIDTRSFTHVKVCAFLRCSWPSARPV